MHPRSCLLVLALAATLPGAGWAAEDIHAVDFRDFTYVPSCADFESQEPAVPVRVTGGRFEAAVGSDREGLSFSIYDVIYGDLTGDGHDEAIVQSVCSTGGSGRFDEGFVYALADGKPVLLGRIPGGDRAAGSVRCIRVEQGALQVDRIGNASGAAAGLEFIDTEMWKVKDGRLAQIGKAVRRQVGSAEGAKPIHFAKGASAGTVAGTTSGTDRYTLQARQGQTMTVRLSSPQKSAVFEIVLDDYILACPGTEWSGELPATGVYLFLVRATAGSASYQVTVGIR
jgi:hypothetical protein